MNIIVLRLFSPSDRRHYEIVVHWPSMHLHEIFEVSQHHRTPVSQAHFEWSLDMQLEEIRVDPLLFPKNLATQLVQSVHSLISNSQEPIVFQSRA